MTFLHLSHHNQLKLHLRWIKLSCAPSPQDDFGPEKLELRRQPGHPGVLLFISWYSWLLTTGMGSGRAEDPAIHSGRSSLVLTPYQNTLL